MISKIEDPIEYDKLFYKIAGNKPLNQELLNYRVANSSIIVYSIINTYINDEIHKGEFRIRCEYASVILSIFNKELAILMNEYSEPESDEDIIAISNILFDTMMSILDTMELLHNIPDDEFIHRLENTINTTYNHLQYTIFSELVSNNMLVSVFNRSNSFEYADYVEVYESPQYYGLAVYMILSIINIVVSQCIAIYNSRNSRTFSIEAYLYNDGEIAPELLKLYKEIDRIRSFSNDLLNGTVIREAEDIYV